VSCGAGVTSGEDVAGFVGTTGVVAVVGRMLAGVGARVAGALHAVDSATRMQNSTSPIHVRKNIVSNLLCQKLPVLRQLYFEIL
jgi:hypothetical protein